MSDWLIFGLGNPGKEYEKTYHNAGLLALQEAENYLENKDFAGSEQRVKDFWAKKYAGAGIVIARVDEDASRYMNQSGPVVKEVLDYFGIPVRNAVIIHDDSDLTLGTVKLDKGRGAAGHHGVESVIEALGMDDFWRVRIGIRPKEEERRRKAGEFVLKRISEEDEPVLKPAMENAVRDILTVVNPGLK